MSRLNQQLLRRPRKLKTMPKSDGLITVPHWSGPRGQRTMELKLITFERAKKHAERNMAKVDALPADERAVLYETGFKGLREYQKYKRTKPAKDLTLEDLGL